MLELYDTNNWARVKFETDTTGLPLRHLFETAYSLPEPAVFFFDGIQAKARRLAIFPDYKKGRNQAPDNFYILLSALKELLLHTKHIVLEVPGYEADDVIATFCKTQEPNSVTIFSTDKDFCALGQNLPMVTLKTLRPEDVRLYKTLVGDISDCVPGLKGFGAKTFETLSSEHKVCWRDWLDGGAATAAQLGLAKSSHVAYWKDNPELLRVFWKVVGFFDVPTDLMQKHIKSGISNYPLANLILKELLQ